ncbi:MAG: hypothetical protein ACLRMZ_27750 [Blautia marasmi]
MDGILRHMAGDGAGKGGDMRGDCREHVILAVYLAVPGGLTVFGQVQTGKQSRL